MVFLIKNSNKAAIIPPLTGEIIQLAAIFPNSIQLATPKPPAAIPAPKIPPTIECVVETGAPIAVAKCSQIAPESKAANIKVAKFRESPITSIEIIPERTVSTTSPPAIKAPEISQIAAIVIAPNMLKALEPTAGPTLLATSLAPILSAIYPPTIAANPKNNEFVMLSSFHITKTIINNTNKVITPILCISSTFKCKALSYRKKSLILTIPPNNPNNMHKNMMILQKITIKITLIFKIPLKRIKKKS